MYDTELSPSWHRLAGRLLGAESDLTSRISTVDGLFSGRHSDRSEIAAETPIFHDLALGRRPAGRREPAPTAHVPSPRADPLSEFRRNPLTAPIPVQVNAEPVVPLGPQVRRTLEAPVMALVATGGAHALPTQSRRNGRHHRPTSRG